MSWWCELVSWRAVLNRAVLLGVRWLVRAVLLGVRWLVRVGWCSVSAGAGGRRTAADGGRRRRRRRECKLKTKTPHSDVGNNHNHNHDYPSVCKGGARAVAACMVRMGRASGECV